jgi:hypothetical protein
MVRFPIILVGKDYWQGLIDWVKTIVLNEKNISPEDLDIFKIADTAEETVKIINDFYTQYELKPNF